MIYLLDPQGQLYGGFSHSDDSDKKDKKDKKGKKGKKGEKNEKDKEDEEDDKEDKKQKVFLHVDILATKRVKFLFDMSVYPA